MQVLELEYADGHIAHIEAESFGREFQPGEYEWGYYPDWISEPVRDLHESRRGRINVARHGNVMKVRAGTY